MCLCIFCSKRYFLFQPEVAVVKPVKFTRDSGCLAHDQFLVRVSYVDIHICNFVVGHCAALHCTG